MQVSTTFRTPHEITLVILIASALHSRDVCEEKRQQGKFLTQRKKAIETWGFGNFPDFGTREPVTPAQMSGRRGQWLKHFCWDLSTLERTSCQTSWMMRCLVSLQKILRGSRVLSQAAAWSHSVPPGIQRSCPASHPFPKMHLFTLEHDIKRAVGPKLTITPHLHSPNHA